MKNWILPFVFGITAMTLHAQNAEFAFGPVPVFNVLDYGASGTGDIKETEALQQAISECAQAGGGTVYFPPGIYISGSLRLFDNVHLYLESGATIKGSPDLDDYTETEYVSEERNTALIYAFHCRNISIDGHGTIDGNGDVFFHQDKVHRGCCYEPEHTRQKEKYRNRMPDGPIEPKTDQEGNQLRPGSMISFIECEHIQIRDIHVQGSPNWCIHLSCCNHADLTGLDIDNSLLIPNADGIDISKCKNVFIRGCDISAGDDGIALGTCADGYCSGANENVVVSDCIIVSRSAGIRLGWSTDDIRNCFFSNLVIHSSNRGIGIFARRKEIIENIVFSDIRIETRLHTGWWGNGEPIHISAIPGFPEPRMGVIRNIRFENITAGSEHGIVMYGYKKGHIKDIEFRNIFMKIRNSKFNELYGGNFDLRPTLNIQYGLFEHDIPGLFATGVENIIIDKFDISWETGLPCFFDHALHFVDFNGLTINFFRGRQPQAERETATIKLEKGDGISITNCTAKPGTTLFLEHENVPDGQRMFGNDLRNAYQQMKPGQSFSDHNH